jgi:hypothetical protein
MVVFESKVIVYQLTELTGNNMPLKTSTDTFPFLKTKEAAELLKQ